MKIGIVGTRGIPNCYGGFEQFAEYLSVGLVKKGHEVVVYNSHLHPYKKDNFNGVKIVHCKDLENKIGTAGQFFYDLNCIIDSRKRGFDIILQLGYTSSSVWGKLLPKKADVITNMDGLEWKRTKYSRKVQKFLLYAEKLAVKSSNHLVADSIGIQDYLKNKYSIDSTYIPYGANLVDNYDDNYLTEYGLKERQYNMLIARLEPENSIEVILDGVVLSQKDEPFLVVGNHLTEYGEYLKNKYLNNKLINFVGGIYNIKKLNSLRYYSKLYFHGHTVGGTNPSLLEAMGSGAYICANDNLFNKSILGDDAVYFMDAEGVKEKLINYDLNVRESIVANNYKKVKELYSWEKIVLQYENLFKKVIEE